MGLLRQLRYEGYLVGEARRLFGWRKTTRFIAGLPFVFFTNRNRTAYELMGNCRMSIGQTAIRFKHPDVRFIDEIITKKCYSPNPDFEIGPNDTIVDAGANVGVFAIHASLAATRGRLFAIEPDAENFRFLQENIRANELTTDIVSIPVALCDKKGTVRLYKTNPGNNSILGSFSDEDPVAIQTCKSVTIGNLIEQYSLKQIDFMKVDIEGAEFLLFKDHKWLDQTRRIAMEVHTHMGNANDIKAELARSGFSVITAPAYDSGALYIYAKRD